MKRFTAICLSTVLLSGCSWLPQKDETPKANPLLPEETEISGLFGNDKDAPNYAGSDVVQITKFTTDRSSTGLILHVTVKALAGSFDPRLVVDETAANRTLVLRAKAVQANSSSKMQDITFLHHVPFAQIEGRSRITVMAEKNSKSITHFNSTPE